MRKSVRDLELSDISKSKNKSAGDNKFKTTDINILLNRVRLSKKIEFKKKLIFLSLTLITVSTLGFIYLI